MFIPRIPDLKSAHDDALQWTKCRTSAFSVVRSIITFFAINIAGHAVTMTRRPGQKISATTTNAIAMMFCHILARLFCSFTIVDAIHACQARWRHSSYRPWRTSLRLAILGYPDACWPLQSAIRAQAVAIAVPDRRTGQADLVGWKEELDLDRAYALFLDGSPVVAERGISYRIVPQDTESETGIEMAPSTSILRTILSIAQLVYGAFELYEGSRTNVRQYGLSSPFIVVIPYIVASCFNLIINVGIPEYPYVLVLHFNQDAQPPTTEPAAPPIRHIQHSAPTTYTRSSEAASLREYTSPILDDGQTARFCDEKQAFCNWVRRHYQLQAKEAPDAETRRMAIMSTFPTSVSLVTMLGLTRARIGIPGVAASFLAWLVSGWWSTLGFFVAKALHLPRHRRWTVMYPAVTLTFLTAVWAIVVTIMRLVQYYSQCPTD